MLKVARWTSGGAVAVIAAGVAIWGAFAAEPPAQKPQANNTQPASPLTLKLGGAERYSTYVSTSKQVYKPGETMFTRVLMLHHASHKPASQQPAAFVEIKGPKGDVVAAGATRVEDGAAGFSWTIPAEQSGGEYTLKVTHGSTGNPPAERKFEIRAYRAPRLKTQIKFIRDGYGPGDEVAARLEVFRAEGGAPAGANVTVIARVDGAEVHRGKTTVDTKGNCLARFTLPAAIQRGEGTLAMVIEDGGVVETASKTIPILLQTVDLKMYPEGGDLVAGLENRVYFEAFTPAKKPADLAGVVVSKNGKEVATFKSEHEGRGRFVFTPQKGESYELKITQPAGIATRYPLPDAKESGVVLTSLSDTANEKGMLFFNVTATESGKYDFWISRREMQETSTRLDLKAGETFRMPMPTGDFDGVMRATIRTTQGQPLAERLVFVPPREQVKIEIEADAKQYTPGGRAKLKIRTTTADGKPVSAVVGLNVTDDSVLEMIDRREQSPSLPVMVLLEDEVQDLADAHVYLDPNNEKAPLAVDLLLGVQGWRRFAYFKLDKFIATHGDDARRALAFRRTTWRELEKFNKKRRFFNNLNGAIKAPQAEADFGRVEQKAAAPAPAMPKGEAAVAGKNVPGAGQQQGQAGDGQEAPEEDRRQGREDAGNKDAAPQRRLADEKPRAAAKRPAFAQDELQEALRQADREEDAEEFRLEAASRVRRDDFVAVRVYAHEVRAGRQAGERVDFTETLFWHAGLKTDAKGEATVEFGLNDSVTSFKVQADAFSAAGALGAGSVKIESVEPFYLEPKLPLEVTAGDQVDLPVAVVNATDAALAGGQLTVTAGPEFQLATGQLPVTLAAGERGRKLVRLTAQPHNGPAALTLRGSAGPYSDSVTRSVTVVPRGFPIEDGRGGLISPGDMVTQEITVPEDYVAGSMKSRVVVYPTPLASMNEALARLIREPYGCFEQTSSSTYPLVMAQQYFKSHQGVDPAMIERSAALLDKGYNRLIGFECKSGGFEWFGADPGHDALTAYGLLEFTDMAKVSHVDTAMLDRTRKWLLSQRDGKGGYKRQTHTLHTWLAEPEVQYTYDTWALLEAGVDADMSREVKWVRDTAEKTQNTYVMALAANVLGRAGDKDGENHMLDKLAGKQQEDGSLSGATVSVVGSGGDALKVETTALAVSAWLNNPSYAANVEKSIQFLAETCKAGRFGSTQSTVLALRAIVAYDASRAKPKAPGTLQLLVDGEPVGKPIAFTADTKGAIELPAIDTLLSPGSHKVQVQMTGGSQMPYSIAVDYHREQPETSEACKLHMQVKLTETKLIEGGATEAMVTVVNRTNEDLPTPTAIIGIPGGLEVRHDQLKELVKSGKIAAYEVLGREVVLYWRTLAKEERTSFPLSLVAAIPGKYTAPASRAYLYYTDEHKHWTPALTAEITAR